MKYVFVLAGCCLFVPIASIACAQSAPAKKNTATKKTNPAFAVIEEDPSLPRVLILGDSISIGYTLPLRKQLEGKANVVRPATNCAYSRNGVKHIGKWLGDRPWDVIHFNFGLHDLKHVVEGAKIVPLGTEGCHRLETEAGYEANLRKLVAKLKNSGAELIWCSTSPVPPGARGRIPGDEKRYNQIAATVMQENGIAINDLHKMATGRLNEIQKKADVHFTPAGSQELARMLAPLILEKLSAIAARQ